MRVRRTEPSRAVCAVFQKPVGSPGATQRVSPGPQTSGLMRAVMLIGSYRHTVLSSRSHRFQMGKLEIFCVLWWPSQMGFESVRKS